MDNHLDKKLDIIFDLLYSIGMSIGNKSDIQLTEKTIHSSDKYGKVLTEMENRY